MHIRYATPDDFPAMVTLTQRAFAEDLMWLWLHPKQNIYPTSWRRQILLRQKFHFYNVGMHILVAETDSHDPEYVEGQASRIAGLAFWERIGESKATAEKWRKDPWFNKVERALIRTEMMYDWHLHVDTTVSRVAVHVMNSVPGQDWFDKYPEHWYLSRLAVDPAFQRRGIGGLLLDWGLRIAKEENVPVGLTSSPQGVALYRRKGFRDIGWLTLTDGIKGPALIWEADPKKIEEAIEADGAVVVSNAVPP